MSSKILGKWDRTKNFDPSDLEIGHIFPIVLSHIPNASPYISHELLAVGVDAVRPSLLPVAVAHRWCPSLVPVAVVRRHRPSLSPVPVPITIAHPCRPSLCCHRPSLLLALSPWLSLSLKSTKNNQQAILLFLASNDKLDKVCFWVW